MAEVDSEALVVTTPDGTTHPNHAFASFDATICSTSDREATTDEDTESPTPTQDNAEVGSIVGISMSRAQTHMKSAHTPAIEKAQALEASRGYFQQDGGNVDEDCLVLTESPEMQPPSTGSGSQKDLTASDKPISTLTRRQSITRAILGDGHNRIRKRSSSGTSAILDAIRKILPDLPSYSGFGSGSRQEPDESAKYPDDKQPTQDDMSGLAAKTRQHRSRTESQPPRRIKYEADPETTSETPQKAKSRPVSIRRTTSDNSLYLKRVATGASEFDDVTTYSKVADMPNSRFKAITDSFAESSIKMPKLGSSSHGSSRNSPARTYSDQTARNTELNARTLGPSSPPMPAGGFHSPSKSQHGLSDTKHPILKDALARASGDLVILGGYRGSILRSAEPPHHQVWIPVKVGLNLRKVDLEVGLTHEDEERMEEKIIPSGILSHIGPIDISRRLMKKMYKCPGAQANQLRIHDYGYDWRLSPHFLSQKLIKFLEGLECNQPETIPERRGAIVIAHSLGGLITRHAVNQRPELFSGVIYAGSPMNCINILGPLRNGDDVLISSRVLTAQVNFTLRTSYALLPEDGRCFVDKETGERYDVDFFDAENWDKYHLSPCINPALTPLPHHANHRKSLVGSITESISSMTPSRSSKRSSWFSGSSSSENLSHSSTSNSSTSSSSSPRDILKDKLHDAKDDLEDSARASREHMASSAKQEIQDSLEPSMKPNHGTVTSTGKPSIATTVTIPKDQAREYLARTLAEVKQFKGELAHDQSHQESNRYPPHAIIFGKSVPTVYGAKVASREAIKYSDAYDDLTFAAGDGVVLASAAQLPPGYRCVRGGRVESDRGHIGLLGDLEAVGQCIAAVIEGRNRGIGLGARS